MFRMTVEWEFAMLCKCGYSFSKAKIENNEDPGFESYALVNNEKYMTFLRREVKVLASSKEDRMRAISNASQYAGSVMVCPECSRVTISWPGKPKTEHEGRECYRLEEK